MTQSFNYTILEEAISWIESGQQVALATVVQTWGSSPFQIGSNKTGGSGIDMSKVNSKILDDFMSVKLELGSVG